MRAADQDAAPAALSTAAGSFGAMLLLLVCMLEKAGTAPPPQPPITPLPQQRYLSSFAYTISTDAPAYSSMWTVDDFITKDADGKERPWQNLILVTGNDTYFAQLSADVLHRTNENLPMLWLWQGWDTDLTQNGSVTASLQSFGARYNELRSQFPHLPPTPWGVYCGDEPDLSRHPARQQMLAAGLQLVRRTYPQAITYLNMLYASIGCPGPNPGGPFLCNTSTWSVGFTWACC